MEERPPVCGPRDAPLFPERTLGDRSAHSCPRAASYGPHGLTTGLHGLHFACGLAHDALHRFVRAGGQDDGLPLGQDRLDPFMCAQDDRGCTAFHPLVNRLATEEDGEEQLLAEEGCGMVLGQVVAACAYV